MKKLLAALAFIAFLLPSAASATCSAAFKAGSICGNNGASANIPFEIPAASIVGTIPLPNGDILVGNASGKAAAVAPTSAGDCTFTFTNAGLFTYTCLKTNGSPFGTLALLSGTFKGNTTVLATVSGAVTTGHAATWDASGNLVDGGGSTGTVTSVGCGASLVCSPSPITGVGTITPRAPTVCQGFPSNVCPTTATSGTYTTPSNVLWLEVYFCGGGGGGGGTGTASNGIGGTGGTSSFNAINAIGGTGGPAGLTTGGTAVGGAIGGTGGTGTASYRVPGQGGGGGMAGISGGGGPYGGIGGSAGFFAGGGGAVGTTTGNAGAKCGGGNGAAGPSGATSGGGGGGGGEGVYLLITSPAASYSFTTGAAGTAGTAGTTGSAGGAGGIGSMYVIEH